MKTAEHGEADHAAVLGCGTPRKKRPRGPLAASAPDDAAGVRRGRRLVVGGHVRTRGSTAATTTSAMTFATTTASEKSRKMACSSGTSGPRIAW